jgi:hypothetical protein
VAHFKWKMLSTSIVLAITLAGCGAPNGPSLGAPAGLAGSAMAAASFDSGPSAVQLAQLASGSPDALIVNAPGEPAYRSEGGIFIHPPHDDLGNFGKLNDTLWRGARPTDVGLQKLGTMGVKTIVNLENDKTAVLHEQNWCQAHGVAFVSIPLSVILPPKMANINQFLNLAENQTNLPLYFHCMQGRDRTGTAAFCYRISHDHWSYAKAAAERDSYHFHTFLIGLGLFDAWYAHTQGGTQPSAPSQPLPQPAS